MWILEPDPGRIGQVDAGYVPVCARNWETRKQDCRLQVNLDFAKKHQQKRFRYIDMKVKDYGIPRTITQVRFCR